ncbi:Chromosome partition protein MukB, partial [Haemophilus influenzae]
VCNKLPVVIKKLI